MEVKTDLQRLFFPLTNVEISDNTNNPLYMIEQRKKTHLRPFCQDQMMHDLDSRYDAKFQCLVPQMTLSDYLCSENLALCR